jgi:hypothetical protein
MWVYRYDIEIKAQLSQWVEKSSPRKKKSEPMKCEGVVDHFFDGKGIIHHEFSPRGQTINEQFYWQVIKRLAAE